MQTDGGTRTIIKRCRFAWLTHEWAHAAVCKRMGILTHVRKQR